jgi:Astacin (Peptidase family M12A)
MVGGEQKLWLNRDTSKWNKGSVIHELCHALGFMHEQCRADRDNYVRIAFENIVGGYESQFVQLFNSGRDIGGYDYASNMHYPRAAFSKNGQDTIVPKNNADIGVRGRLSDGDKQAIAQTYNDEFAKR